MKLRSAALGVLLLALGSWPAVSLAAEDGIRLGIGPAESESAYFDLVIPPGNEEELKAELGNFGSQKVKVRTYAANGLTAVNGGLAVAAEDAPPSEATKWLDYSTEIYEFDPGMGVIRTFSLRVPDDAKPGEYVTTVVIQNADPVKGTGTFALDQVIRVVLPILITVPGPREPGVEIGSASFRALTNSGVLEVALKNTGNVRLKMIAEMILADDAGTEVGRYRVEMGSFYAGHESSIEFLFDGSLPPGDYSVVVSLTDEPNGLAVTSASLPFNAADPSTIATPEPPASVVSIQSISVGEVRNPESSDLQYVEPVVRIENRGPTVSNCRVTLHVLRDGQPVEDVVMGSALTFPWGIAELRSRYFPPDGWTSGTYSFSVTVDVADPATGQVAVLARDDASTTVEVP